MALSQEQLNQLYESTVVSDDGETLGRVGHIYLDDHTQQPAWVTFKTGLFGTKEVFAPLQGARVNEDMIRVRYTKDYISDAPAISSDGHINEEEQAELYRYYRLDRPIGEVPQDAPGDGEVGAVAGAEGAEVGDPPTTSGPDAALSSDDASAPPVTGRPDDPAGMAGSPLPSPSPVDPSGIDDPSPAAPSADPTESADSAGEPADAAGLSGPDGPDGPEQADLPHDPADSAEPGAPEHQVGSHDPASGATEGDAPEVDVDEHGHLSPDETQR